jgi:hypothetical protein
VGLDLKVTKKALPKQIMARWRQKRRRETGGLSPESIVLKERVWKFHYR